MLSFFEIFMRFLIFLLPVCLFASGWAEKTFEGMTLDEKIGQLFMAPACPMRKEDHWADWLRLMEECRIGNAIMKQSDAASQIEFLNRLQTEAQIPLLIAGDTEWGLAMRMSDAIAFPRPMTLGAIKDIELIYEMGKEIGREARSVGIHICLAPVADVNNNPSNPIIHTRSFGEDPWEVGKRVCAYARGLAEGGALACAKHFPGHGDTSVDSHNGLPLIPFEKSRLDAIEFIPFQMAINGGIGALMSAHLLVPVLDPALPASLSETILRKAVREEMGFQGLIISDALNMKALADRYSPEEIAILARRAGTDLLLYGAHLDADVDYLLKEWIPRAFKALKLAYETGRLNLQELDESVLRILRLKEKFGLNERPLLNRINIQTKEAVELKKNLFQEAITLIGESPILHDDAAYLSIGENDAIGHEFAHCFYATLQMDEFKKNSLLNELQNFDQIVIALHQTEGLSEEWIGLIRSLSDRSIFCHFASPYALALLPNQKTILVGYENEPDAQHAVYRVLIGEEKPTGHLPVHY